MAKRGGALILAGLLLALAPVAARQPAAENRSLVMQARLANQAISPATARFVARALSEAEQRNAACFVLVLDTPGGLVDSTRAIVQRILQSEVPVVVHVAPSGARAASAGVFITLAGHVAAMAPATNIGAAHPVQIGGLPSSPSDRDGKDSDRAPGDSALSEKIVNDTVAWARSLAELRGRNADWAARAVRESLSISATEAVRERVVDLLAEDLDHLLDALEGREVTVAGRKVRLQTAGAEVREVEMWWGEQVLATLTNPNVAFLLMIFGFYGVLFELYTPGWGVSGTLGVVCLLLAFVALAILPINYAGLALVGVGLGLFVAEAFLTSYGALTVAGLVCLGLGGTMLVDSPAGFQRISFGVIAPVALATAAITVFLVSGIVRAHQARVLTGGEAIAGAEVVATEPFAPYAHGYTGRVRLGGELWRAVSDSPIAAGQPLEVAERQGLTLLVRPVATSQIDEQSVER